MSIKLGIAPIAWSNDDMPELGGKTSLEQCLKEASMAGFTGIESGGKFPMDSNELIPKLNKEKISNYVQVGMELNFLKDHQKRNLNLCKNSLNYSKIAKLLAWFLPK